MSDEYIRKQDAVNYCKTLMNAELTRSNDLGHRRARYNQTETVLEFIENLPSADVVTVVRCKDCKYWDDTEAEPLCEVLYDGDGVMYSPEPDDFCSYGERKG